MFQNRLATMLILLLPGSAWDWLTTVIGIIKLFDATGALQIIFCSIAASFLYFSQWMFAYIADMRESLPRPVYMGLFSLFIFTCLVDIYTTFVANLAVAKSENPFNAPILELSLQSLSSTSILIIVTTTLCVTMCTIILAYLISWRTS
jgi:hypothetical protein